MKRTILFILCAIPLASYAMEETTFELPENILDLGEIIPSFNNQDIDPVIFTKEQESDFGRSNDLNETPIATVSQDTENTVTTPLNNEKKRKFDSDPSENEEPNKRFSCPTCKKNYSHASGLRMHKRTFHLKVRHECDVCHKTYTSLGNLKAHINLEHFGKGHQCQACSNKYPYLADLKKHMQAAHSKKKYKCPYSTCNAEYAHKQSLNAHIKAEHKGIQHQCPHCKKKFSYPNTLSRHIKEFCKKNK